MSKNVIRLFLIVISSIKEYFLMKKICPLKFLHVEKYFQNVENFCNVFLENVERAYVCKNVSIELFLQIFSTLRTTVIPIFPVREKILALIKKKN